MENQSVVVDVNVSPTHQSEDAEKRGRGVPGSARRGSPRRSPEPPQSFWNVSTEKKLEILKVNLEQHGRIVDEQIRSLRQEFVPQKSMLSDIAALQEEVRQLRAPDVPPSSNLEIQINSLKHALQELSLTVQVLKDERSSYGSTNEGTPTNMATCAEVAVHETEFEALWSEIGDIRRTLQGMCQEGHGVSVSKTESHSMNQTTWRVSVDVPTMDRNYTDEAWVAERAYYHFSQSVWIASFWVGIAPVAESVNVVLMLMLNALLQAYFCVCLSMSMGSLADMGIEDDDLEGLLSWRTTSAHDFKHYDGNTNTSLVARVCGGWRAAVVSSDQIRDYESFDTYIGDAGILWSGAGLCMICLICWLFLVTVDVMDNLHCSVAMLAHWTRGFPTDVHKDINGAFQFRQLSTLRVVWIHLFAIIPRFIIAVMLSYEGAVFLIYTADPLDLILNAIALGFVLELDEVTFDFLPETVRTAMMKTDSMVISKNTKFRWVYLRPIFVLLVAGASLGGLWNLIDVVDRMNVAQEILCGGETDFVFTVDSALGVVWTAKSGMLPEPDTNSYRFFAVLQDADLDWEILGAMSRSSKVHWWSDYVVVETDLTVNQSVAIIDTISKASDTETLEETSCEDHDTNAHLVRLREARGNDSLTSCSDLALQCDEAEVRIFCALTCKCDTHIDGMYLRNGCSPSCDTPVLNELSVVVDRVYGVGSNSSSCTSDAEGWQDTFMEELLSFLVSTGHLERRGASEHVWTASFVNEVNKVGAERFYVSSEGLNVNTWLDTSAPSNLCDAIPYFDTLMETSLCDTRANLELSLGSLEGLCPRACGLCDLEGSETRLRLEELYEKQGEDLSSGLIDFPIFSGKIT